MPTNQRIGAPRSLGSPGLLRDHVVPEISRFLGIVVFMAFRDHAPPHFHARYGGHQAAIAIDGPAVLAGSLPPRVLGLVMEWAILHRDDLRADWSLAQLQQPLRRIAPLE
jgi:hypothetical protein